MITPRFRPETWTTSSFTQSAQCVELRISQGADTVSVRDTKNRSGGQLAVSAKAFVALTEIVKGLP